MTTFLHHGNTINDPFMRHELQEPIDAPVTFIQHDEHRVLIAGAFERPIFSKREDLLDSFYDRDELGYRDLIETHDVARHLIGAEITLRALASLGLNEVRVPDAFPLAVADHLRAGGVTVVADPDAWTQRRRRKTPWELEGLGRAQRAAEAAMLVGARMLKEAEPATEGRLRFEGEILTAEYVRDAMNDTLLRAGAGPSSVNVQSGDACLRPLERGSGPVLADRSCIIDCFPSDSSTGVYAALSRTFVPGTASQEVQALHSACLEGLKVALDGVRPDADDIGQRVSLHFHDLGFPTQMHDGAGETLEEGFIAPVGHGVGLDLQERPWMGDRPDALVEGDLISLEPALVFADIGGVRIGDVVLVTNEGAEHLTEPLAYDLEP